MASLISNPISLICFYYILIFWKSIRSTFFESWHRSNIISFSKVFLNRFWGNIFVKFTLNRGTVLEFFLVFLVPIRNLESVRNFRFKHHLSFSRTKSFLINPAASLLVFKPFRTPPVALFLPKSFCVIGILNKSKQNKKQPNKKDQLGFIS